MFDRQAARSGARYFLAGLLAAGRACVHAPAACVVAPARGRASVMSLTSVFAVFGSHPCWQYISTQYFSSGSPS
jgi:hypothetical protein